MNHGIHLASDTILLQNKSPILLRKKPLACWASIDFVLIKELAQEPS